MAIFLFLGLMIFPALLGWSINWDPDNPCPGFVGGFIKGEGGAEGFFSGLKQLFVAGPQVSWAWWNSAGF
ncbi:MAG: hypothetical protein CM15mP103_04310 [Gammaproteobacteria bacterium]|nr:MAG: hypothetical protein CM15mP103_04310 [Gammaproteobacteria bacterium]